MCVCVSGVVVHSTAHARKSFEGAKWQLLQSPTQTCTFLPHVQRRKSGSWHVSMYVCKSGQVAGSRATNLHELRSQVGSSENLWPTYAVPCAIVNCLPEHTAYIHTYMHQFNSSDTQLLNCACEHLINPQSLDYEGHD